jgi:hypothetical protein
MATQPPDSRRQDPRLRRRRSGRPCHWSADGAAERSRHWAWLIAGFPFAFVVPFLLANVLDVNRDRFYGLYALAVACFVAGWARDAGLSRRDFTRNWR